jgi:hypothetical protein
MHIKPTIQQFRPIRILLAVGCLGLVAATMEVTTAPSITTPDHPVLLTPHTKKQVIP